VAVLLALIFLVVAVALFWNGAAAARPAAAQHPEVHEFQVPPELPVKKAQLLV
jgi:hypothetical protein